MAWIMNRLTGEYNAKSFSNLERRFEENSLDFPSSLPQAWARPMGVGCPSHPDPRYASLNFTKHNSQTQILFVKNVKSLLFFFLY